MKSSWKAVLFTFWLFSQKLGFAVSVVSSVADREASPVPGWEQSQAGNHGSDAGFLSELDFDAELRPAATADVSNLGIAPQATHSYDSTPVSSMRMTVTPCTPPVAEVGFVAAKTALFTWNAALVQETMMRFEGRGAWIRLRAAAIGPLEQPK